MSMICLFLSLLISFGLKYILSYIKIGPLACLLGIFAWNIFFHPLTRGDVYLWTCGDVSQSWCESMLLRCSRSSVSYPTVKSVPWSCGEGWIETLIFRISVSSGFFKSLLFQCSCVFYFSYLFLRPPVKIHPCVLLGVIKLFKLKFFFYFFR